MKLTSGEWSVSKIALGTVISDRFPKLYPTENRRRDIKWYGGYCIAESVGNEGDLKLFAHSKKLLRAAVEVRAIVNKFSLLSNEPAVIALNEILNDIYNQNQTSQCNKQTSNGG